MQSLIESPILEGIIEDYPNKTKQHKIYAPSYFIVLRIPATIERHMISSSTTIIFKPPKEVLFLRDWFELFILPSMLKKF